VFERDLVLDRIDGVETGKIVPRKWFERNSEEKIE